MASNVLRSLPSRIASARRSSTSAVFEPPSALLTIADHSLAGDDWLDKWFDRLPDRSQRLPSLAQCRSWRGAAHTALMSSSASVEWETVSLYSWNIAQGPADFPSVWTWL